MISRCVAFVFSAIALAGCCTSSSGCYSPAAAGGPVAWDGLGPIAGDGQGDSNPNPRPRAPPKHEIIVGPLNATVAAPAAPDVQPPAKDSWAQQQASDQEADAKLNSQLKICHGC
jgi:hypothetical protein